MHRPTVCAKTRTSATTFRQPTDASIRSVPAVTDIVTSAVMQYTGADNLVYGEGAIMQFHLKMDELNLPANVLRERIGSLSAQRSSPSQVLPDTAGELRNLAVQKG